MNLRKQKQAIKKNIAPLSPEARKNLRLVIELQTNDELMESLTRLHLEQPFIDEYMRAFSPIVIPISILGVFNANERRARGMAMTMLCVSIKLCKPAIDAIGMTKRTIRLPDWDPSKFKYAEGDRSLPTAMVRIVYDIRMKKGF